ncbi:MAG: TetR/AcrR family transcriptional regulator [Chloroflexales bacterium]|nr:TetR/AcrR family transcriptional regulator [Chloroflexales bacterium]
MARSVGLSCAQVVAVAAELADEHGLATLTLAQVAARLGVKLPSLYNHVDGLPGLRRDLAVLAVGELGEQLARSAIGRAGDAAVLAVARAYRAYVLAHPGRYAATVRAPAADDAELQRLSRRVVEVVVAVLAPYGLTDDDAIHAVRGLRSLAHGFATLEAAGGFGLALDRDESFERLVGAYIVGLRGGAGCLSDASAHA